MESRFLEVKRQRIAIARVLFSSASLIIFDESTNALDNITESKLLNNLIKNDKSNRSLVFISHRLSLAEKVDKVIFVKNAKLLK